MSTPALFAAEAPPGSGDRYARYRALRDAHPVARDERAGAWVLTRYREVDRVLRDPRFGVRDPDEREETADPLKRLRRGMFLFLDPPDHDRLRALARATFHPRRMRRLRPRIEAVAGSLLRGLAPTGTKGATAELVEGYAYALPVRVIAELLGLPLDCLPHLRQLSDALARYLVGIEHPPGERADAGRALPELEGLLAEAIEERRSQPRDDGLSALVAARARGELDERELRATCLLLFLAGHETTASWIANGLAALLATPGAWARLRAAPQRIGTAAEELLRFESPIQATRRVAHAPCQLAGRPIARGDRVLAVLGAANRDPAVFARPDRLELDRRPNRHLAFGAGAHVCLGAPLARLEAQIAISAFVRHFAACQLVPGGARWKSSTNLRGLSALHVHLR